MIPDRNYERIFYRDEKNRDLFFIELHFFPDRNRIELTTSLDFDLSVNLQAQSIIRKIRHVDISSNEREMLIKKLFKVIDAIPGIDVHYFTSDLLNRHGRYMEFYHKALKELLEEKEFEDYTVFTQKKNQLYFEYVRKELASEIRRDIFTFVTRERFESLLNKTEELASEYVEYYSPDAEFITITFYDNKVHELFLMVVDFQVIMFFIREGQLSK